MDLNERARIQLMKDDGLRDIALELRLDTWEWGDDEVHPFTQHICILAAAIFAEQLMNDEEYGAPDGDSSTDGNKIRVRFGPFAFTLERKEPEEEGGYDWGTPEDVEIIGLW